ncbi:hypothetical protein BDN71DRAFT_351975 [Pleurotus eryngii]|uniref:Uncharacterized protein n=1 Tax=Pleurotus eryngii TaxID=5323 RepID=A0A9P6A313_PLEER|nr:hypothetical protein BDN71DRAFT_351975 [Pleurotus eryngii]
MRGNHVPPVPVYFEIVVVASRLVIWTISVLLAVAGTKKDGPCSCASHNNTTTDARQKYNSPMPVNEHKTLVIVTLDRKFSGSLFLNR